MLIKYYRGVFDRIIFFSPTLEKEQWAKVFKLNDEDCFQDFDEQDFLDVVHDIQETFMEKKGKVSTLIVFDDCVDRFRKYTTFEHFLCTIRHSGCSVWMLCQDVKNINPACRGQFISYLISPNVNDNILTRISETMPIGAKRTKEVMREVRKIAKERGDRFPFLYITKNDPGAVFYGVEEQIVDDEDEEEEK